MKVTRIQARKLCTAAEMELADESYSPLIEQLSVKDLKQRLTRARRLRDKFTGLAARQSRQIQGKAKTTRVKTPTGNAGTVIKAAFFTETLERFEEKLAKVEKKLAIEKAKAVSAKLKEFERKNKEKAAAKAKPASAPAPKAVAKRVPAKQIPAKRGAVRAANARNQAKRDNRR